MDNERLVRSDVIERRSKCQKCGYELTYPEFINDCYCAFHSEFKPTMGLISWLRFAYAEYRVMCKKLAMAKRGLTVHDYIACMQKLGGDIGEIKDNIAMDKLLAELKAYKIKEI